jgi:hypothetical protein
MTVVLGLFVVVPVVEIAGHPEDCAAVGLLCYALAAHLRGDHNKVGWWLSAAILMQTWVVLVCPVLLLATPYGRRLQMAGRALLFPAAVFVICLAGTPSATWRQVVAKQPMMTGGQHTPWYSIAPRLPHYQRVAGAPSRRWAAVLALLVSLVVSRRPSSRVVLLATAFVLLLRPLFETSDWGYFSMPGLILAGVIAATTTRRLWWWVLLFGIVALCAPTYGYTYVPPLNGWLFAVLLLVANVGVLSASAAMTRHADRVASVSPRLTPVVVVAPI